MAFLVAAVLAVGGSAAALPIPASGVDGAQAGAPASRQEPSCALSPNCGGGGALAGGCAFVAVADCAPTSEIRPVALYGRAVPSDTERLPSGVTTPLFHPPQSSWL